MSQSGKGLLRRISRFFKSHILGISLLGVATSLVASYLYGCFGPADRSIPTQNVSGNGNTVFGPIGHAGAITVNPPPQFRERYFLNNAPPSRVALVIKDINEDDPPPLGDFINSYLRHPEQYVGYVPVHTEIRVLSEPRASTSSRGGIRMSYQKVEIAEGEYTGQIGWARVQDIQSERVPK
jgi:hypothetical protein